MPLAQGAGIALRADRLSKRYGDLLAVNELTLEVNEGEVFGLLGPNGAGKTTAINMMCGLLRPDGGQAYIHGLPVHGAAADVRARVGVCPQDIVLWGTLTCLEQLEFVAAMYDVPRDAARRRALVLLETMGLGEKRGKLARTLSGGLQRRLNFIMALVHDPGIVVLDEPEAGLDPQSRVMIREYIKSLSRSKTIILTTHNMDEADRVADRVAIIDHGSLLVVDTPEQLKRQAGEGDVLEVEASGGGPALLERATASVAQAMPQASVAASGGTITVRARGAVELLPVVVKVLRDAGLRPGEVRLRENTLEDAFIALTGRRLRE